MTAYPVEAPGRETDRGVVLLIFFYCVKFENYIGGILKEKKCNQWFDLVFWSHVKKVCIVKTNQFHLRSVANVSLLTLANIVTAISSIVSYYIIL